VDFTFLYWFIAVLRINPGCDCHFQFSRLL